MKQIKANVYEFEGCAVTVDIDGNIGEYAKNFLHIYNNVRENDELLKIENHQGSNDVTVYCRLNHKEALIKYLSMFGEIKGCEKVLMYQMEEPEINFDFDKYDDMVVVPEFDK